jgi:hypothetical protein
VTPGRHKFSVRATDGKGALQNGQLHDTYPDSATDYHAVTETFFDRLPHHCPVDYQDTRRIICRTGGLLLDHLSAFG